MQKAYKCEQSGHVYKWTQGRTNWEIRIDRCKIDSYWELAMKFRKLSWVLCEDLDVWWGGGGRDDQEEGDVNMQVADFTSLQQK